MALPLAGPDATRPLTNEILVAALAKGLAKQLPDSNCIEPGRYRFKGTIILQEDLDIKKGEPTEFRPTAELPIKKLLAVVLADLGVSRDRIAQIITEAARNVHADGGKMTDYIKVTETALHDAELLLGELPAKMREGQTRVHGMVEIVDRIDAVASESERAVSLRGD